MSTSKSNPLTKFIASALNSTTTAAAGETVKEYVSSLNCKQASRSKSSSSKSLLSQFARKSQSKRSSSKPLSQLAAEGAKVDVSAPLSDSSKQIARKLNSLLLYGDIDHEREGSSNSEVPYDGDESPQEELLDLPWCQAISHNSVSLRRKEVSRERKQTWVFKSTQTGRFGQLVRMCTQKLGPDATYQVFGKLGRETGVKEYNAFIGVCIDKARKTEDEGIAYEQFHKAFRLFEAMTQQGLQVEEETYGPFLMYLIDLEKVDEFKFFCEKIKKENPKSLPRLAYYEMLLWITIGNEDKVQELCNNISDNDDRDKSNLAGVQENYLFALCKDGRRKEVLMLLETVDITKVSSSDRARIFTALGMLLLESFAKKFVLELKTNDTETQHISDFIYTYAISMPNLAVEDVVLKFENLHAEVEVTPSPVTYEKLIRTCCKSLKVHVALGLVDRMYEAGMTLSINTLTSILSACFESCEYNLVRRIYSLTSRHKLKLNNETIRSMISLCVKMKDFDSAYVMLKDLEKMNVKPTAGMYNAIMGGYFREKNFYGGLLILKQMEAANVKPDSQTFSQIIGNCNCEEDIIKYREELEVSKVQLTKHVFMALINAYTACGLFEKAKEVALEDGVPTKSLNEIKSVLVSALASHGQMSDALNIMEEIKQDGADLEPKAILSIIEHLQSEGPLSRLLLLLEEVNDPDYWVDGCFRIILYCVRHKHLSSAVDLLKQLIDQSCSNGMAMEDLFDEVFCHIAETEPTDVQFGLDLLQAVKEDIGLYPSRKSLDFLLSACVKAKDLQSSLSVWREYESAGLPYNVLSFVRMYQALLASGDKKSAKRILDQIPDDDPDVCCVIEACQHTYRNSTSMTSKKKKKKKKESVKV